MVQNLLDRGLEETVDAVLADVEAAMVVDPSRETIEAVVDALEEDRDGTVDLFAREGPLRAVFEDFLVASRAADHVADGHLRIRTLPERVGNELVVTDDELGAIVSAGGTHGLLIATDAEFVEASRRGLRERWSEATPYSLRTPPLSAVRSGLEDTLGGETTADFDRMLASMETARGEDGVDEVTLSLLAAARNEQLLYDVSKWGEDVGLASKATISRTKSRLEEAGLLATEKVPIEVGRPRLRLRLADERLREIDPDQLASAAGSTLS